VTLKIYLFIAVGQFKTKIQNIILYKVHARETLCGIYRYYTAEGVRIFSQETWNAVTGGKGKQLVEQHIDSVV